MSWETFENPNASEALVIVLLLVLILLLFFLISLIFPSGKLGDGPPKPFLLSFEYAKTGEIQQENTNFHKRMTKKTKAIITTSIL